MRQKNPDFKAKLIYGLLVVVPFAVLIVIIAKLIEILESVAKAVGLQSVTGAGLAVILALFILLGLCYGVGALIHTRIGDLSFEKFEKTLLQQIPGYSIVRNILRGFTGEEIEAYQPALVQLGLPGTAVIGFVMEENGNDTITVFVPNVPAIAVGALHIVDRERVTLLEASQLETITCISEWGIGSNKLLSRISHQQR
jgi:uncharacterized membrane protein